MAKKQKQISTKLIVKSPRRDTSDVGSWRQALRSADNERVVKLFDLYDDLLIDGVLADAAEKRIAAITNSNLTFQDANGKEVDVMIDLIDTPAFEELLQLIMKQKMYGRSAFEFDFTNGFCVEEIDRRHLNLKKKEILLKTSDFEGIPYEKLPNVVVLGKARDYGLFLKTAPFAIYKRGGFGDYAQWLEIFGMPQRVGKYNAYDTESRRLLEEAMERAGSAPWIVIPNEANVETVNNTGSGNSGISYNDFRKACNEEMLITIQGQTLTTVAGDKGARSLGEVHKDISDEKHLSDMRFVQRILNYTILPILEARGFPVRQGKFLFPKATEPLNVTEIVQLSGILPIPQTFLYDKYGIPIPAKNEAIAGTTAFEIKEEKKVEEKKKEEKPTEQSFSAQAEIEEEKKGFFKKLFDFFVKAPQDGANYTKKLINSISGSNKYTIDINRLFLEAIKEIYGNKGVEIVNKKLFEISNATLQRGISTAFDEAGKEWGKENTDFINEFRINTAVFSAFKNHQQTKDIVKLLTDENGNLRSFRTFKKEALKLSKDYNKNWLRTEYNTAVKAARAAVNYRRYLKTEHLYPNLEYLESSSKNKRDAHFEYVGTILPIRHKWWDIHLPPGDWNCNCSVRPTDKKPTSEPNKGTVNPVFANNPGKTAKFVNLEQVPYVLHTAKELRTFLKQFATDEQKRIAYNKNVFLKLKEDVNYTNVKFNENNGGLMGTHKLHNFKHSTAQDEKDVQRLLYNKGHSFILEKELPKVGEVLKEGVKLADGFYNHIPADISTIRGVGKNAIKRALYHSKTKNVKVAILYFPNKESFSLDRLHQGIAKYEGVEKYRFKEVVYIVNNEVYVYKKSH